MPSDETTALLIPPDSLQQIVKLDEIASAAKTAIAQAAADGNTNLKMLITANAVQALRQHLTPELTKSLVALQDSRLGFKTDHGPGCKDKAGHQLKPYPVEVVRDVAIQAMIQGANMVGNEVNIIAAQCYLTKEYFERQIGDFPGLANFRLSIGVPHTNNTSALVDMRATWKLDGKPDSLECKRTDDCDTRIPVRVNGGMGIDAIIGKAKRKFYARVLSILTGTTIDAADPSEDPNVIDGQVVDEPAAAEEKDPLEIAKHDAIARILSKRKEGTIEQVLKAFQEEAFELSDDRQAIEDACAEVVQAANARIIELKSEAPAAS